MTRPSLLAITFLFVAIAFSTPLRAQDGATWQPISESVIARLEKEGKKVGYPGLTAGVAVDPTSGEVYMVICDQGLWRSSDRGKSFDRADGGKIGGRCETGFALQFDPAGQRLACFMIYGAAGSTSDAGKSWSKWTTNHLDFGAVDWAGGGKTILAFRHESGGVLCVTHDGGQTWANLGQVGADKKVVKEVRDYKALGLFDAKTFVASKGAGLLRSTDAGATWVAVEMDAALAKAKLAAPVMVLHKGVGYWCSDQGILASKDAGKTWTVFSPVKAVFGPWFGGDDGHLVVVTKDGLQESRDAGKTWKLAAPLPAGFNVALVGPNYAWDVKGNVFYASSMGKATYRFERGK